MNNEPPTNKIDRNKFHTSTVWKPSNGKPSRRLVFRLAANTLRNREPGTKHLFFRQVLFGVGMDLDIHGSRHPWISTSMHLLLHLTQFRMTKVSCRQFLRRHLLKGRGRGEN